MVQVLKRFSWVFLFVFTSLFADSHPDLDKYRIYVTEVDPESHRIVLSNKMVFHIAKNDWMKTQLPEIGMEVRLLPSVRESRRSSVEESGTFRATCFFEPKNQLTHVWIANGSRDTGLSYVDSELTCIEPAGWFSPAIYQEIITLSDGSKWIRETHGKIPFVEGERLLLTKIKDRLWSIINIDTSNFAKDENRHPYLYYPEVMVEPYEIGEKAAVE